MTEFLGPDDDSDKAKYRIFESTSHSTQYKIYLSTSFEAPEEYVKLFNLLDTASDKDSFTFYLNSYGGRVDAGIQFGNKLRLTKAHTKSVIEGPCYSMGSIFPFMTREVEMLPNTYLMFHDFSSGNARQKGNEIAMHIGNFSRLFRGLLEEYCGKILTKAEITDIVEGKDLYLFPEDVKKRMERKK